MPAQTRDPGGVVVRVLVATCWPQVWWQDARTHCSWLLDLRPEHKQHPVTKHGAGAKRAMLRQSMRRESSLHAAEREQRLSAAGVAGRLQLLISHAAAVGHLGASKRARSLRRIRKGAEPVVPVTATDDWSSAAARATLRPEESGAFLTGKLLRSRVCIACCSGCGPTQNDNRDAHEQ